MTSRLIFRTARAADLPAIQELVTTEFIKSEPMLVHLRNTKAGFTNMYDRFAVHLDLKTTIVAEEIQESNTRLPAKLVSCHVSIPLSAELNFEGITEQVPCIKLLDELHAPLGEVLKRRSISQSRVLHSMLGATRQEYHGKGLYKQIIDTLTQEVLRDPRWDIAVSECTSPITQHIKKYKFGWTEEAFIPFADFVMKGSGRKPFEGLRGGVALMWKDFRGMRGAL